MNKKFILGTHPVLVVGLVVWMGLGWRASQATLNDLQSLAQFGGLPEGQREEVTFGTDYAGYQYLLGASKPQDVILAVVPDGLYGNKLIYFLYPREVYVLAGPERLGEWVDRVKPNFVYVYYPTNQLDQGLISATNWLRQHNWSALSIHETLAQELGLEQVGDFDQFEELRQRQRGNLIYVLEEER